MQAAGVVAVVAALLANDSRLPDCLCRHLNGDDWSLGRGSYHLIISDNYCIHHKLYTISAACGPLQPQSIAAQAVVRLVPSEWNYRREARPCDGDGQREAIRRLLELPADEVALSLSCHMAADCLLSCPMDGLNDTEWNSKTLAADRVTGAKVSQLVHALHCITKAVRARYICATLHKIYSLAPDLIKYFMPGFRNHLSEYWRDSAQLLSLGVAHLSKLFIPLAFQYMSNQTSDEQLDRWLKDAQRVERMLHTKMIGWVQDLQTLSKQAHQYELEEDKKKPGQYRLRGPLLGDQLLPHGSFFDFHSDFSAVCQRHQHPEAPQMLGLADALYLFYYEEWFSKANFLPVMNISATQVHITDEEWQLPDQSRTSLSVDTDCLQLLVESLERPACPLEELSLEAARWCRHQLWRDVVERPPHLPVTSYLAYNQRTRVSLCLLAWMVSNSFGICQDVPFSVLESTRLAHCYFDRPGDPLCLNSNATDEICLFSRAIFLLKCDNFSTNTSIEQCSVKLYPDRSQLHLLYTAIVPPRRDRVGPTQKTLSYRDSLNKFTLKYKDFKVESLLPLEMSFIGLNIFFRSLTAGVYVWLPHLSNLPGKILLSFQITGMVQVLCSEVLYRMLGIPNLPTAVFIDSALTFLSCLWLNTFCYQMYSCVRHLRLPNHLLPAEARMLFRRQVLYAIIPWGTICVACTALENTSKHYLLYSRLIFVVGISLSVAFNLVCLILVGFMYLRTRKSMKRLSVSNTDKFASKKRLVFMSVKTVILSGIGIIIRIGFHQAQGIAQFVYYVHIATMMQGPVLYVFFVCSDTTLPALRQRVMALWKQNAIDTGQELCSSAERNLTRKYSTKSLTTEPSF